MRLLVNERTAVNEKSEGKQGSIANGLPATTGLLAAFA